MKINFYPITLGLLCLISILPLSAFSRGPVRDLPNRYPSGKYVGWYDHMRHNESMGFEVKNHHVEGLRFLVITSCHNLDTNQNYPIPFITGKNAIPPISLNSIGKGHVDGLDVVDNTRILAFSSDIKVDAMGHATVHVILFTPHDSESRERCSVDKTFPLQLAPHTSTTASSEYSISTFSNMPH